MAPSTLSHARDKYRNMKSGGGVLVVSSLQLIVGLVLLGIYEGYKVKHCDVLATLLHAKPDKLKTCVTCCRLDISVNSTSQELQTR